MIKVFYNLNGQAEVSESLGILKKITLEDALWLDLFNPTGEEKRAVESFLHTTLQSRAQAEEIESSSRYHETVEAIFANTNFLIPSAENYTMESVSFVLTGHTITSIRQVPLRSFTDIQRRILFNSTRCMQKEIGQYSKRVSLGEDVNEEFLLDINQLQENTMLVRENIVDKQRMISSVLRSDKTPDVINGKLGILLKDISSLINHTDFSFERLEYLQNTVLGLIELAQNKIMKIFTLVSVLLMPPTLIASFYGMNIQLPLLGGVWDMVVILAGMLLIVLGVFLIFRKKKML